MNATYDDDALAYRINAREVTALRQKGACEAIIRQSNANIRIAAERLRRGEIETGEFYATLQRETKTLHMAQAALARGGIDAMTERDWARVSETVFEQWNGKAGKFPGLRAFAQDIVNGRYGARPTELSSEVLNRAGMAAQAGRATYENERVAHASEKGHGEAQRVKGAVDHCKDCAAWAGVWKPIDEIEPIGSSVCGVRCHCVIVTRRTREAMINIARAKRAPKDGFDEFEEEGYSPKELRQFRKWGQGVTEQGIEKLVPPDVFQELENATRPGSRERIFLIDKETGKVVDFQIGTQDEVSFSDRGYASAKRLISIHQHDNGTPPSGADWYLAATREKFEEVIIVSGDSVYVLKRPKNWKLPVGAEPDLEIRFDELYDELFPAWLKNHDGDENLALRDALLEINEKMEQEYGISYTRVSMAEWKEKMQ